MRAALARAPAEVLEVLLDLRRRDQRVTRLRQELEQAGVAVRLTDREELQQLARGVKHQGVLARVRPRAPRSQPQLHHLLAQLDHPALLLVLDQIQDPHNLGACLRTADGADVDAVILPKDGTCPISPSVTRVAAGAAEHLPIFRVTNLARTLSDLQKRGIWIIGADAAAATADCTLYEMDFTAATAIVLGAEGHGLRRLTRQHCDRLARIPLAGSVSALNVSVAAGLFLFEAVRQRAGASRPR